MRKKSIIKASTSKKPTKDTSNFAMCGIPQSMKCSKKEIREYSTALNKWAIVKDHHLSKAFTFSDYKQALNFITKVVNIGVKESHYPSISFRREMVQVNVWSPQINGLTIDDFIVAAAIDKMI